MKIISITTIKNEADIIESFVRYHVNIMDLMIILDNGSTDDTLNIINNLKKENLPIVVLIDKDKYFEPFIKYNYLLDIALNEYSADIVCPLDCDEFIICQNGNPRRIIEEIPKYSYFKVKWRTYVPTVHDDENIKFVPSRITNIRDENLETNYKVIIPKELVDEFNIKISIGNHDVDVCDKFKNKITLIDDSKLNIAHFPLRSVNQTKSKVLLGYPNTLSRNNVVKGTSFHYEVMFEDIKNNNNLSMEDVTTLAKKYSLDFNQISSEYKDESLISIEEKPIDLSFCRDIDIKYSFDESPLSNLLNNYIYFAKEINTFKNKLNRLENDFAGGLSKSFKDENEKFGEYEKKLKENNLKLKEENFVLKNNICQLNEELNGLIERNNILTKTKIQLSDELNELKEINSQQEIQIFQLKNRGIVDYITDRIR